MNGSSNHFSHPIIQTTSRTLIVHQNEQHNCVRKTYSKNMPECMRRQKEIPLGIFNPFDVN